MCKLTYGEQKRMTRRELCKQTSPVLDHVEIAKKLGVRGKRDGQMPGSVNARLEYLNDLVDEKGARVENADTDACVQAEGTHSEKNCRRVRA
ncbi:MAG: hypothetical protein NVS4B2_15340 [Chloroflexota bacterium]